MKKRKILYEERRMRRGFGKLAAFAFGSIAGGAVVANTMLQKSFDTSTVSSPHGGRLHRTLTLERRRRTSQ